jgi:hypothetical protein
MNFCPSHSTTPLRPSPQQPIHQSALRRSSVDLRCTAWVRLSDGGGRGHICAWGGGCQGLCAWAGVLGHVVMRWGLVGTYGGSVAMLWDPNSTRWYQVM